MAERAKNVIDLKARRAKRAALASWCVTELPFVKDGNNWAVALTGDHDQDAKTGRDYAFAFMEFEHRKPRELQGSGIPEIKIIMDMIAAGQDNEIVRSFFFTLTECSVAAWEPDRLAALRTFYTERDRRYAESQAEMMREEFQRRSAAAKKAAETRRARRSGGV
jgi:hypothetical protein